MVAPLQTFRNRAQVASTVHKQRRIHLPHREGMTEVEHAIGIISVLEEAGFKANTDYSIDPTGISPFTFMLVMGRYTRLGQYPLIFLPNPAGVCEGGTDVSAYNLDQVAFIARGHKFTIESGEWTIVNPLTVSCDYEARQLWISTQFTDPQVVELNMLQDYYLQDRILRALAQSAGEVKVNPNGLVMMTPEEDELTTLASAMLFVGLCEKVGYYRPPYILSQTNEIVDTQAVLAHIKTLV